MTFLDELSPFVGCIANVVDRGWVASELELYAVLFAAGFPADAANGDKQEPANETGIVVRFAGSYRDFAGRRQVNIHVPRDVPIPGFDGLDLSAPKRRSATHPTDVAPVAQYAT
jgi:hypothetical protein